MENTKNTEKPQSASMQKRPVVAITSGDINGIGYEIILKSLADPHICELCTPIIYGNVGVVQQHLQMLDEELRTITFNEIKHPSQRAEGKINIINCYDNIAVHIGRNTKDAGTASLAALDNAVNHLKQKVVDLLVTAPINKENIQSEQFRFSGHTEYLTHHFSHDENSLMMMVSEQMKVALVTNHVPLSKVAEMITEERILSKLRLLNDALRNDFMIEKPRIAVLALNPHAGDNGLLGMEEKEVIIPAIKKAEEDGVMAFGPYSADGFFGSGNYRHFDAILGMYHDQGLIPFKSLDMDGVNFTAGLDIIRTSPDHGTAYELAGRNKADAASFRNALYLALDLLKTRKLNEEIHRNPLI